MMWKLVNAQLKKIFALENRFKVLQPQKADAEGFLEELDSLSPDF